MLRHSERKKKEINYALTKQRAPRATKVSKVALSIVKETLVSCGLDDEENTREEKEESNEERIESSIRDKEDKQDKQDKEEEEEERLVLEESTENKESVESSIREVEPKAKSSKKSIIDPLKFIRNGGTYKEIFKCKSKGDLDTYLRLKLPATRVDKSNKNGCTICDVRKDHKMTYIERRCKCKLAHCNLKIKILKCERQEIYRIYQKGDNIHELNDEEAQSQQQKLENKQQQHGIHETIKSLIKEMCDESEELTPMAIHTRIIRNHRRKKYNFSEAIIPTLNKVIFILLIFRN